MKKVIELFKQIKETSSINEKKEIIIQNRGNELFKKCLKFLLDNNIVTGISNKKIAKMTNEKANNMYLKYVPNTFEELMEYLIEHNTGTDMDVACVRKFICSHSVTYDDCEFYEQMVTKKFRLGADAKLSLIHI